MTRGFRYFSRLACLAAALVLSAGCGSALGKAKRSESHRDYEQAIYWYAAATAEGNMQQHELQTKMMKFHQDLGEGFCFHLNRALKRIYDDTAALMKKGKEAAANKEAEKSHVLGKVRTSYCTEEKEE
jgi:hypothetical protein